MDVLKNWVVRNCKEDYSVWLIRGKWFLVWWIMIVVYKDWGFEKLRCFNLGFVWWKLVIFIEGLDFLNKRCRKYWDVLGKWLVYEWFLFFMKYVYYCMFLIDD